jgi:hypothetical protein
MVALDSFVNYLSDIDSTQTFHEGDLKLEFYGQPICTIDISSNRDNVLTPEKICLEGIEHLVRPIVSNNFVSVESFLRNVNNNNSHFQLFKLAIQRARSTLDFLSSEDYNGIYVTVNSPAHLSEFWRDLIPQNLEKRLLIELTEEATFSSNSEINRHLILDDVPMQHNHLDSYNVRLLIEKEKVFMVKFSLYKYSDDEKFEYIQKIYKMLNDNNIVEMPTFTFERIETFNDLLSYELILDKLGWEVKRLYQVFGIARPQKIVNH